VDVFFKSPPHLFGDYDGNVGCVGSGFDNNAPLPSTGFLSHVGNAAILSAIQFHRITAFSRWYRTRNVGNVGWYSPL